MPDRFEDQPTHDPQDLDASGVEWLYDTLDQTSPEIGPPARRGFPCGTLLLLFFGIAVIAGIVWLLIGPPLPAAQAPPITPTATPTLALPTLPATPDVTVEPTRPLVPEETPAAQQGFEIGDRVIIIGTGSRGVRLRAGAGLDFLTQGIYQDGDAFFVMPNSNPAEEYPVKADGYRWWRVRSVDGLIGWTVEEFLEPAPLVAETATPATPEASAN